MPRTLVLYYSVTGHTETLARAIGQRLSADIEAIRPDGSYTGALGAVRGIWQHITRSGPRIKAPPDPSPYELVVVGTPVWGGSLSAPVRAYLSLKGGSIRRLAGFWVSASGQQYAAIGQEMEHLSGRTPVTTRAFSDSEVKTGQIAAGVEHFVAAVRASSATTRPSEAATLDINIGRRQPPAMAQ